MPFSLSDSYQGKSADTAAGRTEERRVADRGAARRRSRAKARKPYDLDSEGEETSDGSSSEKVGLYVIKSVPFLCSSGNGLI